jgi:hypothetical protein
LITFFKEVKVEQSRVDARWPMKFNTLSMLYFDPRKTAVSAEESENRRLTSELTTTLARLPIY